MTLSMGNPNDIAKDFTEKFNIAMDKHAPINQLKIWEFAPDWLNTDYLGHVDEREFWCKQFDQNPSILNLHRKEEAIERTKQLKDELQRSYFNEELIKYGNDAKKKNGILLKSFGHTLKNQQISKISMGRQTMLEWQLKLMNSLIKSAPIWLETSPQLKKMT